MNEDKELNKLSDGMPICEHGIPLDSECKYCQEIHHYKEKHKRADDIFKTVLYTGSHLKYEIKNKLSITEVIKYLGKKGRKRGESGK
jgi:hypothetical protein